MNTKQVWMREGQSARPEYCLNYNTSLRDNNQHLLSLETAIAIELTGKGFRNERLKLGTDKGRTRLLLQDTCFVLQFYGNLVGNRIC